jgi:mannosyltransferase
MIVFDGVIFKLQRTGGISVLFKEIIRRMPADSYRLVGFRDAPIVELDHSCYEPRKSRPLERYRRADFGEDARVFHSTYYRLPTARGPKVVTTVYDFVYERFASWPSRFVHSWQKRRAIEGADRIICISESTRRDLLNWMGHTYEDRTVVIPLAASEVFRPLAGLERRPQALFVGTRVAYKNFHAAVMAVSMLPEVSLMIVGGGPLTQGEHQFLTRHLDGRFHAAGYLSDAALNEEYNRSLCLVYPSLYEGFGIPILEAMRAGCPVIAFNGSSIPEVAGTAALLLECGDGDEIRAAIERLMDDDLRRDAIARGLTRAAAFTWDETFANTVSVYRQLAEQLSARGR